MAKSRLLKTRYKKRSFFIALHLRSSHEDSRVDSVGTLACIHCFRSSRVNFYFSAEDSCVFIYSIYIPNRTLFFDEERTCRKCAFQVKRYPSPCWDDSSNPTFVTVPESVHSDATWRTMSVHFGLLSTVGWGQ